MSNTDTSLEEATSATSPQTASDQPRPVIPGLADTAVAAVLDLDELLSSARRVRRSVTICLRADLEGRLDQVLAELGDLVDEQGIPLDDSEGALGDANRATDLQQEATEIRAEMKQSERRVDFEAMPSDEWDEFEKAHRKPDRSVKDIKAYETAMLTKCAIEPTLTPSDVEKLKKTLSASQMDKLFSAAFGANTTGGLDVPKLPSYSHVQKPQEH